MTSMEILIGGSVAVSASMSVLISACCFNIRRLRCSHVRVCGRCIECSREVMTASEMEADAAATRAMTHAGPARETRV